VTLSTAIVVLDERASAVELQAESLSPSALPSLLMTSSRELSRLEQVNKLTAAIAAQHTEW